MRSFLVVISVVLTVNADSSCENICKFLYNNPDWESHTNIADTAFRQSVPAGSVTGIVTASFETLAESYYEGTRFDYLKFIKGQVIDDSLDESDQPLSLEQYLYSYGYSDGYISGKQGGKLYGYTALGYKILYNIQISDLNSDSYDIFFGDPGEAYNLKYKYGSSSTWERFKNNNVRLRDTQTIRSSGRYTVNKYISACTDPKPRLCDDEQHVSENVNLGSSFILSCSGSGAPFLDVTWTKDGNPTDIEPTTVHTNTEPDHKIQSSLTIDRITLTHLGTWTCTILNKNFKENVTKIYKLKYSYPATIVVSPKFDYYHGSESHTTTLTWVVHSWPLEQVTLDCGNISVSKLESTVSAPPHLIFTLALRMQDVVNCNLKDGEKVLETREITRVGYNCKVGEGGEGKECEVCETGKTSVAGIGDCFSVNSSCTAGVWGVEQDCSPCPKNLTSFDGAVKVQECFPDVSYCEEGYYGYGTNCSKCPDGTTSKARSKKLVECYISCDNKSSLVAGWTLAGIFFSTTIILSVVVFKKLSRGKCFQTDDGSVHEYVENTITHPPSFSAAADTTYDNHELYKL